MYTYQYYRDNPQEFKKYKGKDLIPYNCQTCSVLYHKPQRSSRQFIHSGAAYNYCSKTCQSKAQVTSVTIPCAECSTPVTKIFNDTKRTKNTFCSNSHATSYNNKHKKHGIRRSKLETYLENFIRSEYPNLDLICNGKDVIESELDFYFPSLRLAIELNGIVHYEPIYGQDKFERIQNNDKQKMIRCYEQGIELVVLDSSKVSYLTDKIKAQYASIVKELLEKVVGRVRFELTTN